jgi:hypothetical protein
VVLPTQKVLQPASRRSQRVERRHRDPPAVRPSHLARIVVQETSTWVHLPEPGRQKASNRTAIGGCRVRFFLGKLWP